MTLAELNEHLALVQKLERAKELYKAMSGRAYPGSPSLDGMPRGTEVSDRVGALAAELADISTDIAALEREVNGSAQKVQAYINGIENAYIRVLFQLRFLRGYAWKEVAATVGGYTTEEAVKMVCYRYLKNR
ncbi:MAG: hypothetical protein LUC89_09920 [Oscillospiraceae bacterium]|nr:hypothetical protein [Oscillospiraceae bacterium]